MASKIFSEGIKTFGDDAVVVDIVFNLFLVAFEARRATLIESANDRPLYNRFVKWLTEKRLADFNLNAISIESEAPQFLVFNTNLVTLSEALSAVKTSEGIGRLLGFECAGQLGGGFFLDFYLNENVSFYSESCYKMPSEAFIKKNLKKFQDAANHLVDTGLLERKKSTVTYRTEEVLKEKNWIKILVRLDDDEVSKFFDRRNDLSNIFANSGMYITADMIDSFETPSQFVEWCRKYKQMILYCLCLSINDPLKTFYPLNEKQEKRVNISFEKLEEMFFSL